MHVICDANSFRFVSSYLTLPYPLPPYLPTYLPTYFIPILLNAAFTFTLWCPLTLPFFPLLLVEYIMRGILRESCWGWRRNGGDERDRVNRGGI